MTGNKYNFDSWRDRARGLLSQGVVPDSAIWTTGEQASLFLTSANGAAEGLEVDSKSLNVKVPSNFIRLAKVVCASRESRAHHLLYSVLCRIAGGESNLLNNPLDENIVELRRIERAIRKDIHKMHAFVRFVRLEDVEGEEFYTAWHRPDHFILRLAIPFFVRRFGSMNWRVETPDESASLFKGKLTFSPGIPNQPVMSDPVEENWLGYYGATFNPARIKIKAMKKELPVRHWQTLPETRLITRLLEEAPKRVEKMMKDSRPKARPEDASSLSELKKQAASCNSCSLCARATQTVFGQGPETAELVLVGEQPGDEEDKAGIPFVGPAGEVLDNALLAAGIIREKIYLTNAVKHFKWEERGKRRLHKRPNGDEIVACHPWLLSELKRIKPKVVVCLGATAAHSVLGRTVSITGTAEQWFENSVVPRCLVTYHPSAVLRASDYGQGQQITARLVRDLRRAIDAVKCAK